jgi:hypothetical protein
MVESKRKARMLHWDDVGCANVGRVGNSQRRRLNITDRAGKSIVSLDESFGRFDEMVATITGHIEAKGDDTALRIMRKKGRKTAVMAGVLGVLMTLGSGFIAWETSAAARASRLLAEKGQPGKAELVRRFVAPNGVTHRIEYRVAGASARNIEVDRTYWNELKTAKSVPVIYVADEPDVSKLARGEVTENDFTKTPAGGYGLAALGAAFGLFMLIACPFAWNGWDLSHDKKTGKWSVKRYGKVVWGQGSTPNATTDRLSRG